MIATPDRTPLPGKLSDRPVLEAAPDRLRRIPVRVGVVCGEPGHAYVPFTRGTSGRSS
ncbi:3-methyladenine DNA glycosylase [Streptomyces calvus]|jgi:hypothetical protein|uniref:3-methyladenine DNA glycosylase n=1 Tax=Streptomyces calvus TaxID=67282 RepID=A0A514JX31_9ACTN|nr:3-methyladenine DNA glycosylase [Streptomyces calvus]